MRAEDAERYDESISRQSEMLSNYFVKYVQPEAANDNEDKALKVA